MMIKTVSVLIVTALILAGCSSAKPERIETDSTPPKSPCACGPRVKPLLWDAA